jgi:hypothetical protein
MDEAGRKNITALANPHCWQVMTAFNSMCMSFSDLGVVR